MIMSVSYASSISAVSGQTLEAEVNELSEGLRVSYDVSSVVYVPLSHDHSITSVLPHLKILTSSVGCEMQH